jgi:hypothetical protein
MILRGNAYQHPVRSAYLDLQSTVQLGLGLLGCVGAGSARPGVSSARL